MITTIATGITSLIFLFTGLRVWSLYKEDKNSFAFLLAGFLLFFFLQQFTFFLATGLLTNNEEVNSLLWIVSHLFTFIGISIFIRFPFRIKYPRFEDQIFAISVAYSIFGSAYLIYNSSSISPIALGDNIIFFEVPLAIAIIIGAFTTLALFFISFVFASEAGKIEDDPESKTKLVLLSLGTVLFLIGSSVHNFVYSQAMLIITNMTMVLGALVLLAGIETKSIFRLFKR